MNSEEKIFDELPFLRGVTTTKTKMPAGTPVFSEGESCGKIGFILDGVVRVYKLSETGREMTLYRIGHGESCILSMSCALSNPVHKASAVVEENATLLTMTTQDFRELIDHSHEAREYIFNMFAERLSDVLTILEEVVFHRMDERLAALLLEKISPEEKILRMTHEELAVELGTAREVISRLLKEFEQEKILRLSRGTIEILDEKKLRRQRA